LIDEFGQTGPTSGTHGADITAVGAISSVPCLDGDFDCDGDIDGADFLAWQLGDSPNPLSAADLALWQANYGSGALAASSTAVPEPSTLTLLAIALLGMSYRQRKRA
jgi:hypothetical protein